MPRTWRTLVSAVPFLPATSDSTPSPDYIPLPRLSTSALSTPGGSVSGSPTDEEKRLHHLSNLASVPIHHRRSAWIAIWIYLSPFVVLALAVYCYLFTKAPGADRVIDPYACAPKASFASVSEVCKAAMGSEKTEPVRLSS